MLRSTVERVFNHPVPFPVTVGAKLIESPSLPTAPGFPQAGEAYSGRSVILASDPMLKANHITRGVSGPRPPCACQWLALIIPPLFFLLFSPCSSSFQCLPSLPLFFLVRVSAAYPKVVWNHVVQAAFEPITLLPQWPQCWDSRYMSHLPSHFVFLNDYNKSHGNYTCTDKHAILISRQYLLFNSHS